MQRNIVRRSWPRRGCTRRPQSSDSDARHAPAKNLPGLIADHGYSVLAAGCLLEGETVLLLAGFAARRVHLALPAVIGVAAVAGFLGDQSYFWLGRRHGPAVMGAVVVAMLVTW